MLSNRYLFRYVVRSVAVTPANTHDSQILGDLLHGEESVVWGDFAYSSQKEVMRSRSPRAHDMPNKKGYINRPLNDAERSTNRNKSKVRSKVGHVLRVMRCRSSDLI